jgi:F0F1-type ATP synthase membrane subunit b/b'
MNLQDILSRLDQIERSIMAGLDQIQRALAESETRIADLEKLVAQLRAEIKAATSGGGQGS